MIELKYGTPAAGGVRAARAATLLRRRIDEMPNEQYQALFGAERGDRPRGRCSTGLRAGARGRLEQLLDAHPGGVGPLVRDLGGHDLADVLGALRQARETHDRPTVIFAYTIKGYGLEIAGRPQNHSALLTRGADRRLRAESRASTPETEWDGVRTRHAGGGAARRGAAAARPRRPRPPPRRSRCPPTALDRDPPTTSTQAAFGRILLDLSRVDGVAERLVTVAPDVSTSTNLGGFINKTGVWGPDEEPVYDAMEDSPLKWRVGPRGQHIEMGIAEMNLVLLLGQLGLSWDFQRERLFPIGTLYDPFVMRALEGIVYSTYSGSRFVLAGTPSGISLSREGGAHQSIVDARGSGSRRPASPTPSRATRASSNGCSSTRSPGCRHRTARRSTCGSRRRPSTRRPSRPPSSRSARSGCARDVVAGGFRLREPRRRRGPRAARGLRRDRPRGARGRRRCSPTRRASRRPCSASPHPTASTATGRRAAPRRCDGAPARPSHLERLLAPGERGLPVVTVIDGASHALSFVGGALGVAPSRSASTVSARRAASPSSTPSTASMRRDRYRRARRARALARPLGGLLVDQDLDAVTDGPRFGEP